MKLVVDKENNISYLYLNEEVESIVDKTIEKDNMNIDLDENGNVIGIEFLNIVGFVS